MQYLLTLCITGNGVLFKPSDTAVLSNYIIFQIMKEVGVPPGVVNFVPSDGPVFGDTITSSPGEKFLNSKKITSHKKANQSQSIY